MTSGDARDVSVLAANARNNAQFQSRRASRWRSVRDEVWRLLDPLLAGSPAPRVALVGGGSCDDLPIRRIVAMGASVHLFDIDEDAARRGRGRVSLRRRGRVETIPGDVTGGAADVVVRGVASGTLPTLASIEPLRTDALGEGMYDVVVGDMLYTQLLHPGLLATRRPVPDQTAAMRRFDRPLAEALVRRLHASVRPGGSVVHINDVACWSPQHAQPLTIEAALADPPAAWARLARHDACDPALVVERLRIPTSTTAWWRWPFEPAKEFLVRAVVCEARRDAEIG